MWNENLEDIIVVKRSGQRVEFNASKIAIAIKKGFEAVYENPNSEDIFKVFESVLAYINENYKDRKTINVEDIQDIIENTLKKQNCIDVYNAYHNYREKRLASRQVFNEKQQHKFVRAMEKLNDEEGKLLNDSTPENTLIKFGGIIASEYVKSYVIDSKTLRAMEEGLIYLHNLDNFSLGYFSKVNLKIKPKEEDKYLIGFIREIEGALKEVSDEVCISEIDVILEAYFLERYKIILGNYLEKYLSFTGFIDFVPIKKFTDVIRKSDSIENIVQIINDISSNEAVKKIIDKSIKDADADLDLYIKDIISRILNVKSTKAKLTIDLSNKSSTISKKIRKELINSLNDNEYSSLIHVIFHLDNNIDKISKLIEKNKSVSVKFTNSSYFRDGTLISAGLGGEENGIGRMVSAASSLNMVRIALKCANKDLKEFYEKLDGSLEVLKNALTLEFETLGNKYRENYEVLFRGNVLGDERLEPGQKIRKIIKTGILNIGLIGLYECVCLLESNKNNRFKTLIEILKYVDKKCESFKEDTKLNFVLCEPSDDKSLKRLINYDKSIYSVIKDVTDKERYTHLSEHLSDKEIVEVQNYLHGGFIVKKKILQSGVSNALVSLQKSGIEFVTFDGGSI